MRTIAFAPLVLLSALVAGGCKGKTDPTGGPVSIEGTYTAVELEQGGMKAPKEELDRINLDKGITITADTMRFPQAKGTDEVKKYNVNAGKSPAEIDFSTQADGKTHKEYGIYKMESDTLTIVVAGPIDRAGAYQAVDPKDRPREFNTRPNSSVYMIKLKKK